MAEEDKKEAGPSHPIPPEALAQLVKANPNLQRLLKGGRLRNVPSRRVSLRVNCKNFEVSPERKDGGKCKIGEFNGAPTFKDCEKCEKRDPIMTNRRAVRPERRHCTNCNRWDKPKEFVLKCGQSPGDILLLAGAVREVMKAFRLEDGSPAFLICPDTNFNELWNYNPYVVSRDKLKDPITFESGWCAWWSHQRSDHLVQEWTRSLVGKINEHFHLELPTPPMTEFRGEVRLSPEERAKSIVPIVGDDEPYWILDAGSKDDYTTKRWPFQNYQAVVDGLRGKVRFVQMGRRTMSDFHNPLNGVVDCIGKTEDGDGEVGIRKLLRLFYRATGVVTPISFPLHACAAVPTPTMTCLRHGVCIAGGKEPQNFVQTPGITVLSTIGKLPCCALQACWTDAVGDRPHYMKGPSQRRCLMPDRGIATCMRMITPEMVIAAVESYLVKPPQRKLKIAVCSLADEGMAALRDLSFANKQEYCDRHGYTFVGETDIFHEKDEKGNQKPDRPASWSKIPLILKLMPEFDWVWFSDADSVITNMDFKLEDVIADAERGDYNFVVADDRNGRNCGQMMFKKTLATWNFLRDAWSKEQYINSGVWEQSAIHDLLQENPERIREMKVPQRLFNSYPENWQKGDFVLHCPRDKRWDRMEPLLKALSGAVDHFDVGPP